jgi:hypothetical protein
MVNTSVSFNAGIFSMDIQNSLPDDTSCHNSIISDNLTIEGILYRKGWFLPLEKNEGDIVFGKIQLILIKNHSDPYFIVEKVNSVFLQQFGV